MVNLKFSKTTAFFTAAFMASAPFSTICAADANTIQIPVYEEFNQNDVNGQVIIDLPEGVTAHVDITFDSPEGKDIPYYSSDIEGSSESAIFKIETALLFMIPTITLKASLTDSTLLLLMKIIPLYLRNLQMKIPLAESTETMLTLRNIPFIWDL